MHDSGHVLKHVPPHPESSEHTYSHEILPVICGHGDPMVGHAVYESARPSTVPPDVPSPSSTVRNDSTLRSHVQLDLVHEGSPGFGGDDEEGRATPDKRRVLPGREGLET